MAAINEQIIQIEPSDEDEANISATPPTKPRVTRWTYRDAGNTPRHNYQEFKEEIDRYLKQVGCNQSRLAEAMSCHSTVLNRKLSGVRPLKISHLKQILKFMVEWGALTDIASIEALLKLRNLNLTIFSSEDWHSTPLCQLASAAVFAEAATGNQKPATGSKTTTKSVPIQVPASNLPTLKQITPPHNLPLITKATFIGRKRDLTYLSYMLSVDTPGLTQVQAQPEQTDFNPIRLLTLTGPGGIGKTRLALQLGGELLTRFEQGVYFVDLVDVRDVEQLPGTIARTIGLNEVKGIAIEQTLKNHLKARNMLLILDNFEQLIEAGLFVNELLEAAPGVKIIVTSREVLHLYDEQEYIVPLMSLPNLKSRKLTFMQQEPSEPKATDLASYEAVALFVQRAKKVRRDFNLTDDNARAIAEICLKLEGLPLAIELAASRIKLLSPQEILERLTNVIDLQDGLKDRPGRHQTLRAVIDWSYTFLNPKEQDLFKVLAAFANGFTFEAVTQVYGEKLGVVSPKKKQNTIANLLTSLVDKNLLRVVEVTSTTDKTVEKLETRYFMLESIREYALELLEENQEEATQIRNWHATYYLQLAEEAEPNLRGGGKQVDWLNRLHNAHENFSVALHWFVSTKEAEKANRFTSALIDYWLIRGYFADSKRYFQLSLALAEEVPISRPIFAKVLRQAGNLYQQYDLTYAQTLHGKAKDIYQELGDVSGVAFSYLNLGNVFYAANRYSEASNNYLEAANLAESIIELRCLAMSLSNLGNIAVATGNYEDARNFYTKSVEVNKTLGNELGLAKCYLQLARLEMQFDNFEQAKSLCEQSLAIYQRFENTRGVCSVLFPLGVISLNLNDYSTAKTHFSQALALAATFEQPTLVEGWLDQFALVAISEDSYLVAARAWSLIDILHKDVNIPTVMGDKGDLDLHKHIYDIIQVHLEETILGKLYSEAHQLAEQRDKTDYMQNLLLIAHNAVTATA